MAYMEQPLLPDDSEQQHYAGFKTKPIKPRRTEGLKEFFQWMLKWVALSAAICAGVVALWIFGSGL